MSAGGQVDLFDYEEGVRRRDAGISMAEEGAGEDWITAMDRIVREVASVRSELSSDDVWAAMVRAGIEPPDEPRAIGPVMMRAKAAGIIKPTGRFVATERASGHAGPRRIWVSTIFGGA
jgi:hypothetical protein